MIRRKNALAFAGFLFSTAIVINDAFSLVRIPNGFDLVSQETCPLPSINILVIFLFISWLLFAHALQQKGHIFSIKINRRTKKFSVLFSTLVSFCYFLTIAIYKPTLNTISDMLIGLDRSWVNLGDLPTDLIYASLLTSPLILGLLRDVIVFRVSDIHLKMTRSKWIVLCLIDILIGLILAAIIFFATLAPLYSGLGGGCYKLEKIEKPHRP